MTAECMLSKRVVLRFTVALFFSFLYCLQCFETLIALYRSASEKQNSDEEFFIGIQRNLRPQGNGTERARKPHENGIGKTPRSWTFSGRAE